jgi:hypothetical protein
MASIIIWSMYLGFVERVVVSWGLMWWPRLMLCSAVADLSGCFRQMWCFTLASKEWLVCMM